MKNKFLNQLEKELYALSDDETKEILDLYKERIENCLCEGKTETEVIDELEAPKVIAKNFYTEYGININKINQNNNQNIINKTISKTNVDKVDSPKIIQMIIIIFLDFTLIFPLIMSFIGMIISALVGSVSIGIIVPVTTLFSNVEVLEKIIYITGGITGGIISLYITLIGIEISLIIIKHIIGLHMKVFGSGKKQINDIYKVSILKRKGKTSLIFKLFTVITIISLIICIISIAAMFLVDGQIKRFMSNDNYLNEIVEYDETISLDSTININSDMEVKIINSDEQIMKVISKYDTESKITLNIIENENNIYNINIESEKNWLDNIKFNREVLEIHIPVNIYTLNIKASFSEIDLVDLKVQNLILNSEHGDVDIKNIFYKSIDINVLIGDVVFENIKQFDGFDDGEIKIVLDIGDLDIKNIDSKKIIINSNVSDIEIEYINNIKRYNDSILEITSDIGDIDLDEVYIKNVNIESNIADFDFDNIDKDFDVIDNISVKNGDKDINIG